jgi:hypothetical protein
MQECKRIYEILCEFNEFIEEYLTLPFLEKLIEKIDQEPNASREWKLDNLTDIISMSHIIDYDIRESIIQKIIDILCAFYQEDKEWTREKLSIFLKVNDIEKYEILDTFCKKVKSDRETSYKARDLIR